MLAHLLLLLAAFLAVTSIVAAVFVPDPSSEDGEC